MLTTATSSDQDEFPRHHLAGVERQMPGAVSRKDFLRLGGAGLASMALLGATGCVGSRRDEVVRFLDATTETTALERTR
jgi:hypothetical protein